MIKGSGVSDVAHLSGHLRHSPLRFLIVIQESVEEPVAGSVTEPETAHNVAGDNASSVREVLPETLKTQHHVHAAAKYKEENPRNIGVSVVVDS